MLEVIDKASSINVRKVLWTCAVLDLPFRHTPAEGDALHAPSYLALNPNAQVPVLRDGMQVLWESNTICRYLARRAGRHDLLPADPATCAVVEQWMDWQATELNTAWGAVFMARVRRHPAWTDDDRAAASLLQWNRLMAILDAQLRRSGEHVTGKDFTLADVVLGLSTQRWRCTPGDKPVLAAVDAWFERLRVQPGFAAQVDNGVA